MRGSAVIILFVVFTLFLLSNVSALDACCERADNGEWCQYTDENDCDDDYLSTYSACGQTSYCQVGTCYSSDDGTCYGETPRSTCEAEEGTTWSSDSLEDVEQCQRGCCVLADQAFFVTEVKCKAEGTNYEDAAVDFDSSITTESACLASVKNLDWGCCVEGDEYSFVTRAECAADDADISTNFTEEGFHEGMLCSNDLLSTDCAKEQYTGCYQGNVYWYDSCGNRENIYEVSSRGESESYNDGYVLDEQDSCAVSGPYDSSCGNCDYIGGTLCGNDDQGVMDTGDYTCIDLNCEETYAWDYDISPLAGSEKLNGESWCLYDTLPGEGRDTVGSRQYRHLCINGEEIVEECADFREEICISGVLTADVLGTMDAFGLDENNEYVEAGCRENRVDCTTCNDPEVSPELREECCVNEDARDCYWQALDYENEEGDTEGVCLPQVPPGLKFWSDDGEGSGSSALSECAVADASCEVTYRLGGWKALTDKGRENPDNWDVLSESPDGCTDRSWLVSQNGACRSQGDCGAWYNYNGDASFDGLRSTLLDEDFFFEHDELDVRDLTNFDYLASVDEVDEAEDGYWTARSSSVWKNPWTYVGIATTVAGGVSHAKTCQAGGVIDGVVKGSVAAGKACSDSGQCESGTCTPAANKNEKGKCAEGESDAGEDASTASITTQDTCLVLDGSQVWCPFYGKVCKSGTAVDGSNNQCCSGANEEDACEASSTDGNDDDSSDDDGGIPDFGDECNYAIDEKCTDGNFCNSDGECEREGTIGDEGVCTDSKSCASGTCTNGKCVALDVDLEDDADDCIGYDDGDYDVFKVDCPDATTDPNAQVCDPSKTMAQGSRSFVLIEENSELEGLCGARTATTAASEAPAVPQYGSSLKDTATSAAKGKLMSGITDNAGCFVTGALPLPKFITGQSKSTFTSAMNWATLAIGVYLVVEYMNENETTIAYDVNCRGWQPPSGGDNCELCNDVQRPCSEYRCRSLGASCDLVNEGTSNETCVSLNVNDVNSPDISVGEILISNEVSGATETTLSTDSSVYGYEVNELLPAFTNVQLGIVTDEPAICKYSAEPSQEYEDLQNVFGSGLYLYNHSILFSLGDEVTDEEVLALTEGIYTVYVRCADAQGNANERDYFIQFEVDTTPDLTPPEVLYTSLDQNSYMPYKVNDTAFSLYTNEPADCLWNHNDTAYEFMSGEMECADSGFQQSSVYFGSYECSTTLEDVAVDEENMFYFRCVDQTGNMNEDSFVFTTLQSADALNITSLSPEDGSEFADFDVYLEVETEGGAEDGDATCGFATEDTSFANMVEFAESNASSSSQYLSLTEGAYEYWVVCRDVAGNEASASTAFEIAVDDEGPALTSVYVDTVYVQVTIVTDEEASCEYAPESFTYGEGSSMNSDDSLEHEASYSGETAYYITCEDLYENQAEFYVDISTWV